MSDQIYSTYLDEEMLPYPFCPGCGHSTIVDQLDRALVKLNLDPHKTVIVTDIGCVGLSDRFFEINAFHGLHGRSLTYATGIKLANPELKVIVLIGDGGCGIGGNHLIHAARRNIGITTLVFNNLNYGMTGGEHSVTTPPGAKTATTRYGQLERPMDICATVGVNGASFVARTTSFNKNLSDLIVEAIQNDGFSLIDIWELCVAHFVPSNRFNRRLLEDTMESLGFASGVLHQEARQAYSRTYREATASMSGTATLPPRPINSSYEHTLKGRLQCLIAGTAGQRVRSAALALGRRAFLGIIGYPKRRLPGHSAVGALGVPHHLSPEPIVYSGLGKPELLVVLSIEGLNKVANDLAKLDSSNRLYINAALLPVQTAAKTIPLDLKAVKTKYWSLVATAAAIEDAGIYPLDAYRQGAGLHRKYADENLAAIDKYRGAVIRK